MIDGDFKFFYPNGNLKAKGQFYKNHKTGIWEFYSSNGKLLLERNYVNNFNFKSEENIPDLKVADYEYWHINDYDISYTDIFLTLISNNNINKDFFENDLLLNEIKKYVSSKKSVTYNDDKFTNKIDFIPDENLKEIKNFAFKEIVFYDVKHRIINRRVLGIMPVEIKENDITPLFSIYEPSFREFLNNDIILNKIYNNQYYGEVIKIYDKDSNASNFEIISPSFTNENISWFDIKKPFDLEAFYLEKEVNNNLRMTIEPELYVNPIDSLNIINRKEYIQKYKFN
ncbi:hypothetical protein [Psychroserpens mesophilus]|uniref:hypothetical protein n=1 Tax=Psychroserpens mesophilus TaxID=325473 RepID=UPI0013632D47|nr:hypothetical protein [Psychroserpens mesophilus]